MLLFISSCRSKIAHFSFCLNQCHSWEAIKFFPACWFFFSMSHYLCSVIIVSSCVCGLTPQEMFTKENPITRDADTERSMWPKTHSDAVSHRGAICCWIVTRTREVVTIMKDHRCNIIIAHHFPLKLHSREWDKEGFCVHKASLLPWKLYLSAHFLTSVFFF